ncbi:phosphoribosylformylglycinamidine synthase I [Candidatus Nomurabacteria bacterium RIFCSPLOWO2_02_FULL_44_12]|uniref:Phosphoribosylformylglycinamidine synthase I n=1 Tax=Candidatus Nomurabacteria bacterium RIFCSPLOWO2_12_FULL_44_11 TaxID=1801796 RepID=A0A1F6Y7U5_9BACT|nr:MAG: phosphoribosylformylglycinamidine synthase I [Candidatus Nomurabacteria bacterium RIFCSPHIGHO2_12_FULL_44_22b]OGJ02415.1 MAG: phosphoribosylformylglycinamidine synthase I [Candidatus Nomurabacteria bacterium RIFCSPLOWO2_12_FULL_44_11]OGJ07050.1 MAG: phosphoribosylformylglycinamidine synthase I [Candidatus Nomurabacteria bacterium RIFCSPLOWO2_02_FULL_44_12]
MTSKKPKVIVMSGYGLNCEEETKFAFEKAGGIADIVHLNDLIASPAMLKDYDILAFPGGFAYGDDTGSGKAYANKFKNHLSKELEEFLARDTLVIGICNGFQIVTSLGILPGALTFNSGGKYLDRWLDLKVEGRSPWLTGIKTISVPIAHGEGRYVIDEEDYRVLKKNKQIAFTYTHGKICKFQNLEANPNGSMHDIAGVLAYNGRVLGLMPHTERAMFAHQSPTWQKNKKMVKSEWGEGILIFKNAINYFLNKKR